MDRITAALAAFTLCAAPSAWAASCPDGSIAMYVSGQGEFCPDAAGRYTVRVSPAPAAIAPSAASRVRPSPVAVSPLAASTSTPQGAMQSGNVRLLEACRNLACHVQEGYQPGLTTVEVQGQASQYEGRSLEFVVADAASKRAVIQRKVGVMIGGAFTTSIAAYNLPAGQYVFGFRPVGGGQTIGLGMFAVGGGGNASTPRANAAQPTPARQQAAHGSSGLVGTWYGVGGTMGKIELHADGTYTSNGAPAGRYQVAGNQVTFTGNLAAWNGGHATLKRADLMEFYWKNASGGINYFAFGKY